MSTVDTLTTFDTIEPIATEHGAEVLVPIVEKDDNGNDVQKS